MYINTYLSKTKHLDVYGIYVASQSVHIYTPMCMFTYIFLSFFLYLTLFLS